MGVLMLVRMTFSVSMSSVAARRTQSVERDLDHAIAEAAELIEQGQCLGGEEDLPGPPIGRVAATLDQASLFEPVDHPAQGDRLDLEQIGKSALIDPLMSAERYQRAPLRARHADQARALVEASPHQARYIADQEAK